MKRRFQLTLILFTALSVFAVLANANPVGLNERELHRVTRGDEQLTRFIENNAQTLSDVYLAASDSPEAAKKELFDELRALSRDYPLFRFFERIVAHPSIVQALSQLNQQRFPRIVAVATRLDSGVDSTCDIYGAMIDADLATENRVAGTHFDAKARCHLGQQDTDAALQTIADADRLIPGGYPLGHLTLGDHFHSIGDYSASFLAYQQAGLVGYGDSKLAHLEKLQGDEYQPFEPQRGELVKELASRLTINFLLVKNNSKAQEACELASVCDTYFNLRDQNGRTPLITYAGYEDEYFFELIPHLINAGADVNQHDHSGNTAIFYAATSSANQKVEALVAAGAHLGLDNASGLSLLDLVSLYAEPSTLALLLGSAPEQELNRLGPDSMTPLMHAARVGNVESIHRLLAAGADIHAADEYGRTAYVYALLNSQDLARAELEQRGAHTTGTVRLFRNEGSLEELIEFDLNDGLTRSFFNIDGDITKKTHRQGRITQVQEFASWSDITPVPLEKTYQLVDNQIDGEKITYYFDGSVAEIKRYQAGEFQGWTVYTRNGVVTVEFIPTGDSGIWERNNYYKDTGRLLTSYRMRDVNSISDYTLMDYRLFDAHGNAIETETYDPHGNVVSTTRNYDFQFQEILQDYLSNPERGIFHYFLDLEENTGLNVADARAKLEAIITDAGNNIRIKDHYSASDAKAVMDTIGRVIRSHGIVYDDEHIDVFSKVLDNRRMDCDIVSFLYLSIGERYHLPIAMAHYPGHAALVWNSDSVTFFWEATSDSEFTRHDYQQWLGTPWFADFNQHTYYASPRTKREAFLNGLVLIAESLITKPEQNEAYRVLMEEGYASLRNINSSYLQSNADHPATVSYLADRDQWLHSTFAAEDAMASWSRANYLFSIAGTTDELPNAAWDLYAGVDIITRRSRQDDSFRQLFSTWYIPMLVDEFERTGHYYEALDALERFYQGELGDMAERHEQLKDKLKNQDASGFAS